MLLFAAHSPADSRRLQAMLPVVEVVEATTCSLFICFARSAEILDANHPVLSWPAVSRFELSAPIAHRCAALSRTHRCSTPR